VGRTIVSTDPELVVTNGDGVAGNPSLAINLTPVGKLLGGTVQTDINYLGEVYNANNGFSLNVTAPESVTSSGGADASGPITVFGVASGANYSDGNFNTATGNYTVPTSGRWEFGGDLNFTSDATARGSFVVGGLASANIPAYAALNDFNWGWSVEFELAAGAVVSYQISAVAGVFTTTLVSGSVYGRLIQPLA